jgi:nucleotide-binding universal stress UspA family protein
VDFSEFSRHALEWSTKFSRKIGARLTVLHVLDTEFLTVGNLVTAPYALEELRLRAEETLASMKREHDLEYADVRVVEGVPEDAVVNAANDGDVDLVVMGTHGLSGFQRLLLGSVTEKVLHRVKVPLLALSPWLRPSEPPGFRAPGIIVMAVDFGPESKNVVRHAVWMKEHYRAKLIALHVVSIPFVVVNVASFEPLSQLEVQRVTESLIDERRKELRALLSESDAGETEIETPVGSTFGELRTWIDDRSTDRFVMGAGGHG